MAASGHSRANENKAIRQEALREQLRANGHMQQAVDILGKIKDLAEKNEGEPSAARVGAYKAALDGHLRLLNKLLPDLKAVEYEGAVGVMTHEQFIDHIAKAKVDEPR